VFTSDKIIAQFRGPFGVSVEIGSSIILLGFIFVSPFGDTAHLFENLIYFALILITIFLHEMGHAWATLVQGHGVKRIMVYGGGGFCQGYRALPLKDEEFVVVMGPIVNLALWAISSLAEPFVYDWGFPSIADYLYWFAGINIFLFTFNLIPVNPLDGGKLLFLISCRFTDRSPAVRIAGFFGLCCAILWIPAMIYCFVSFGFLLLFMPSITLHWRMFRGEIR
jgi:stage IV sporulation protein FB